MVGMGRTRQRSYGKVILQACQQRKLSARAYLLNLLQRAVAITLRYIAQLMSFFALLVLGATAFLYFTGALDTVNNYLYALSQGFAPPLVEVSLGKIFFFNWLFRNLDGWSRFAMLITPVALVVLLALLSFYTITALTTRLQRAFEINVIYAQIALAAAIWLTCLVMIWLTFNPALALWPMAWTILGFIVNVLVYALGYAVKPKTKLLIKQVMAK